MQPPAQSQSLVAFSREQAPVRVEKSPLVEINQEAWLNTKAFVKDKALGLSAVATVIGALVQGWLSGNILFLQTVAVASVTFVVLVLLAYLVNLARAPFAKINRQNEDIDVLLNGYSKQFPVVEKLSTLYGEGRILKGLCQNGVELKAAVILDWWRVAKFTLKDYGDADVDVFGKSDEELNDMPAARAHWINNRLRKLDIFIGTQVRPPQLVSRKAAN